MDLAVINFVTHNLCLPIFPFPLATDDTMHLVCGLHAISVRVTEGGERDYCGSGGVKQFTVIFQWCALM